MAASDENTTTDAAITAKPPPPASSTPAAPTATPTPTAPTTSKNATTTITTPPIKIKTKPGASIYSKPLVLTTYDKYVLGFSMTYLWRCPSSTILVPLFRQNFSPEKHLDIGVGTGFFVGDALAQVLATSKHEERKKVDITLMDLNETALETAKERVLRVIEEAKSGKKSKGDGKEPNVEVKVTTITADVLDESLPREAQPRQFKSVSMFNLLHCLPSIPSSHGSGDGQEIKNRAFRLAAECLADDGTLAGCTILGRRYISNAYFPRSSQGPPIYPLGTSSALGTGSGTGSGTGADLETRTGTQRAKSGTKGAEGVGIITASKTKTPSAFSKGMTWTVMKWYNSMGTFGNWTDEREVFEKGLRENFEVVETQVVGCMLLFNAARPKR